MPFLEILCIIHLPKTVNTVLEFYQNFWSSGCKTILNLFCSAKHSRFLLHMKKIAPCARLTHCDFYVVGSNYCFKQAVFTLSVRYPERLLDGCSWSSFSTLKNCGLLRFEISLNHTLFYLF